MNIGPILRAMKHNRTRVVLIILEIAMTLAIVTNCVNVILAERAKMLQTSGFDDENILWLRARPFTPDYRESAFLDTTIDADLRAISSIPGVKAAANTHFKLWEGGGSSTGVKPVNVRMPPQDSQQYFATKDIVEALGARIIAGRGFRTGDHGIGTQPDPANVTIISRDLAEKLFPGQQAVGKTIHEANNANDESEEPLTVIGVMERFFNPFGIPGEDQRPIETQAMFLPARVGSYTLGISYLVRVEPGTMNSVIPEIEKRLTALNSGRVFDFLPTPEKKARWFSSSKIVVTTMTFIIIALVAVTALGILGLTSLAVAERTRQIGTRRALGATRGDILRHFLTENWILTTAGLVLGVIGAYALNFLLVSHVSDVKMQWELVVAGMVLLWLNGLLATIPPAFRATLIAPSIATKSV
jgi:putative ABC transport system permease protein